MKNNKQDILINIRIRASLLKLNEEDLIRLYGKNYKQLARLTAEELKPIAKNLKIQYERTLEKTVEEIAEEKREEQNEKDFEDYLNNYEEE